MAPACVKWPLLGMTHPAVFPSVVLYPWHQGVMVGIGQKDSYAAYEAQEHAPHPDPEIPHGASHCYQLGGHREDLAPRLLHPAACGSWGAACAADRIPLNPKSTYEKMIQFMLQTFNMPVMYIGNRWQVGAVPVDLWQHHWHCHGLWGRGHPHSAHLGGVRPPPSHPASRPGCPGPDRLPHEDPHWAWLQLHHHHPVGNHGWHQGEDVLCCPGLRAGDGHSCVLLPGESSFDSMYHCIQNQELNHHLPQLVMTFTFPSPSPDFLSECSSGTNV